MTDYNVIGVGLAIFASLAGFGTLNYLINLNSKQIAKYSFELSSKISTERRILAQTLYGKDKKDDEVKKILDELIPLPKFEFSTEE